MVHNPSGRKLLERQYFRLLPLQILLLVLTAVNGLISGIYGSNFVSMEAMSAIGLYMPFSMLITVSGNMLLSGSQIMCSRLIGDNQVRRSQHIFKQDLILTAAVSIMICAFLLIRALSGWTGSLHGSAGLKTALNHYMIGQAAGVFPLMMGQQLSSFLSMENRQLRPRIASASCILSNLFFCDLLVRNMGMGTLGLSLASACASWIFFLILAWYYVSGQSDLFKSEYLDRKGNEMPPPEGVRGGRFMDIRDMWEIIRTGIPAALHNGFEMFRTLAVNSIVMHYVRSVGVSSLTAVNSVMSILWTIPFGMVAVSRILMGISFGEQDRKDLTDVMRIVVFRCVPILCVTSAVMVLSADSLTGLFFRDPSTQVYQITRTGFRLLPLCLPFTVFSQHFVCYAQLSGQHFLEYLNPFLAGFAFVSLFSAILTPVMGMTGVYLANVINSVLCCLVVVLYAWMKRGRFPRNMEELMVIRSDFGQSADRRLDLSVRSMQDVQRVSIESGKFCTRNGIDHRRAFLCSLFLEEMTGNVIRHGFRSRKRHYDVEARVAIKEGDVFIRIKDNCRPFNPAAFTGFLLPEDPASCIGIRLVFRLAKEVQYQNILGLNVLTIYGSTDESALPHATD